MDLKLLLLRSMSSEQPLQYRKLVFFGKIGYSLNCEIKGKYMKIKRIKKFYTSTGKSSSLRKQKSLLCAKCRNDKEHEEGAQELNAVVDITDVETQTNVIAMESKSTEMELHAFAISRDQQTVPKYHVDRRTQTEVAYKTHAAQTDTCHHVTCGTQTHACATNTCSSTQTEMLCNSVATQTAPNTVNNHMQTDCDENIDCMKREQQTTTLLMEEVATMILNQNQLLHNNSTMLGQLSDMMLLKKTLSQQKHVKSFCSTTKHKYSIPHARPCIVTEMKCEPKPIRISRPTQTTVELRVDKSIQSTPEERKRRRKLFCCCG